MRILNRITKLRREGLIALLRRRYRWYLGRFQVNNRLVGRLVEALGNKVRMDGMTFCVDSPQISTRHKSTLAFGLHEVEERQLVARWIPSDVPLIELGGGLGVVSCLANRNLLNRSKMVVVEANPKMIPILSVNRDVNGCGFAIVNMALGYDGTDISFGIDREFVGSSSLRNKHGDDSWLTVKATTVAQIMDAHGFDQVGIICDIEGTEADLIKRELPVLGERVRYLMAEMHPAILGHQLVQDLLAQLSVLGFRHRQTLGDSVFYSRD